ncbi:MAG: hypothetical protein J7J98_01010 [candidate division Zixibacteria bacterium]|nr:hypothetical protein [candidate division Zixibacteria bacterium]
MKRLIALLLTVVFCVTLFPTVTAFARDPRLDPVSPDQLTDRNEDTPWADQKSPTCPNQYPIWLFISGLTSLSSSPLFFISWITIPIADVGGDDIGNNEANNTGTTLEVGGTSSR